VSWTIGNHTEAAIQQLLDYDVRDFERLEVLLDVKLSFQSLAGGGCRAPSFRSLSGWTIKISGATTSSGRMGFTIKISRLPHCPRPVGAAESEQIPQDVWFPYESGKPIGLVGDNKPAHITGLTIYASG